ncbi:hypothetical protein [Actinoplanes sp. GCM10030250]|uniref:hypothetical protein n=1 Tax=Actinoplanes sp. GCM10030250 TaxID=3273376 RepID=UPI0036177CB2
MDRDTEIDRLMDRASTAALESLDAKVDVQQRLRRLLERAGADPEETGATSADHARSR